MWMMYSAARPVSFWINPSESTVQETTGVVGISPIDTYILAILIITSLCILFARKLKWFGMFKRNVLIGFYFLYCGISILLLSDYEMLSFRRWIKEIGFFLSVLIVLTEADPISAAKILLQTIYVYTGIIFRITNNLFS